MILVLIIILTLVSAATLFFVVRAINPNPETNPTFQDALTYSLIGSVIGRLPFGGLMSIGFWVWVFSQKFYLNSIALILCSIVQYAVTYAVAILLISALY